MRKQPLGATNTKASPAHGPQRSLGSLAQEPPAGRFHRSQKNHSHRICLHRSISGYVSQFLKLLFRITAASPSSRKAVVESQEVLGEAAAGTENSKSG